MTNRIIGFFAGLLLGGAVGALGFDNATLGGLVGCFSGLALAYLAERADI